MIASFRHGFIHIKNKKTAGTSVEVALAPLCGPDDIITPLMLDDEILRMKNGRVLARNFAGDRALEARYRRLVLQRDDERLQRLHRRLKKAGGYVNHVSAEMLRARLPARYWESALKFAVERHPYEKAVSLAYHRAARKERGDFPTFLDAVVRSSDYNDRPRYTIDGQIAVDLIVRQESLEDDLRTLAQRLGMSLEFPLPRAKGGFRLDRRPAAEILTDEQKRIIYENTRETFEDLGYRP